MDIPREYAGRLIGRGGRQIKAIQKMFPGSKIYLLQDQKKGLKKLVCKAKSKKHDSESVFKYVEELLESFKEKDDKFRARSQPVKPEIEMEDVKRMCEIAEAMRSQLEPEEWLRAFG